MNMSSLQIPMDLFLFLENIKVDFEADPLILPCLQVKINLQKSAMSSYSVKIVTSSHSFHSHKRRVLWFVVNLKNLKGFNPASLKRIYQSCQI